MEREDREGKMEKEREAKDRNLEKQVMATTRQCTYILKLKYHINIILVPPSH